VHRRSWVMTERLLLVEDWVEGEFSSAVARFHMHPSVEISFDAGQNAGALQLAGGQVVRWQAVRGKAHIEESRYSPEFGGWKSTRCLALDLAEASGSCLELVW